ncbi:MAG: ATP-binding protein [Thermoanaerobaculum sp.]|nr:ATP-binding protein [Thermoanaerobaculum sp.]MDW7968255.1 ATP-binding protein [Thermoanaerobaculum sp.]
MGEPAPKVIAGEVLLAAESGAEADALHLLDRVLGALGVGSEALCEFRLAVVEACLNALEYGRPPVKVAVEAERGPDWVQLVVRVEDHGPGFSPSSVPPPQLADKLASPRKRGWGLEIMRRFTDRLEVDSQPGKTVVTLYRVFSGV